MPDSKTVGVVGLGYVGLPLAMAFARAGQNVIGVDHDPNRIRQLAHGESYIGDVAGAEVALAVDSGRFVPSCEYQDLTSAESVSICVPTPLSKSKDPDMTYVADAMTKVGDRLMRDQVIILESTVYPGATEEFVAPLLESRRGWRVGREFHLAFSPERIDPGNHKYALADIPKIIGGVTPACTDHAVDIYGRVFSRTVRMKSAREAEMVKLLENTFRAVNIGLINELAMMAHDMKIDIWSVIHAAATKPFGYMPFYPGPGWGGHCIPVDPFYLTWRARQDGLEVGFIEQAGRVNERMPRYVVSRIQTTLNASKKPLNGAHILLLGVAYKKDVADLRESPALSVIQQLDAAGAHVSYHDPWCPTVKQPSGMTLNSVELNPELLSRQDCVVILTDHSSVDYEQVILNSFRVLDTRNATSRVEGDFDNVERI